MSTPGSNLFLRAIRLIKPTTVKYFRFKERVLNEVRQWVDSFDPPFIATASVQAVSRSVYKQFGLDFQKKYIKVFAPVEMLDLSRGTAGDQIAFNGRRYQISGQNDWYVQDGWASCIAVDIGVDVEPLANGWGRLWGRSWGKT